MTLTISEAARRCGVPRSTLQRAIQAGRLVLTPSHQLTETALIQAGYLDVSGALLERSTSPGPQQELRAMLRAMKRSMQQMLRVLTTLEARVQTLQERSSQTPPAALQERSRPDASVAPHAALHGPPDAARHDALQVDTAKHFLGVLCKRGHDYQGTGQSLRKVRNKVCLACDAAAARARRRGEQTP
jgi:hypothetical protein